MNHEPPDWSQIVEEHSLRVFRIAMRILGSTQDAEDVAQDTFTEAYRLHQAGPIQSWTGLLVRIATLRSLDQLRRRRPTVPIAEEDRASISNPLDALATKELALRLRQAVGLLPDQQATVFVLNCYEQMSREEIASHLGISQESVSTTLYKARKRLTELLSLAHFGE